MTDNTQNWHFSSGEIFTANVEPSPFKLTMMGSGPKPAGAIIVDKDIVSFDGDFDESAQVFVDFVAKVWSPQWKAQAARILELEQQIKDLTPVAQPVKTSEDEVFNEVVRVLAGRGHPFREICTELIQVKYPLADPSSPVYDFIQRFNNRPADQSTLVDLRSYIQTIQGVISHAGRVPDEEEAKVIEMGQQCEKHLVWVVYGSCNPADFLL